MAARLLPPLTLVGIALTFVAGAAITGSGHQLGTPLPPLLFGVDPRVDAGWAIPAALVVAAAAALAPRLATVARRPEAFALALFALALLTRVAVGSLRAGPQGMDDPFNESFEATNEYPSAFGALRYGTRFFLDHFAELDPSLPVHVAGHPPGLLLALDALGLRSPGAAAAFVVVVGATTVPLTYAIARRLLDEPRARTAGLLSAFACATTLYGATAADVVFAAVGAAAVALLLDRRRAVAATAGAAMLAVGSFLSYALLAVGAYATLVRLRTDGLRGTVVVAAACAAVLVGAYALLYAATGFAILDVLRATSGVYAASLARVRPYAYWLFGSPAAFLVFLGLPLTWWFARALAARAVPALALAAVMAISSLGGFTKAETERIWLMFVPLACVAAAAVLPQRRLRLVLGLLAAQTLLVEAVFGTVW